MKIIWTDGLNRDYVPDRIVVEHIATKALGKLLLEVFMRGEFITDEDWYLLVEDDYKLKKGI